MSLYRKKPVVIEARQVCSVYGPEVAAWCGSKYDDVLHQIKIETLEGVMTAQSGDWIIKGVQGEFYPIKDPIFRETYESAEVSQ
jgi:hypothetical protein